MLAGFGKRVELEDLYLGILTITVFKGLLSLVRGGIDKLRTEAGALKMIEMAQNRAKIYYTSAPYPM